MNGYRSNARQNMIRLNKTPSPSSFGQIHSPRAVRVVNNNYVISSSRPEQQYKINNQVDASKMQTKQVKNRQNLPDYQNQKIVSKPVNFYQNNGKSFNNIQQKIHNPYNYYYQPQTLHEGSNELHSKKQQQKNQINLKKFNSSSRSVSRKSSINSRDENVDQNNNEGPRSYPQTIRKLANQNIKLKHQYKIVLEKYEKIALDRKNIGFQNENYKCEIEKIRKINQQMFRKQANLQQQIKNLKKLLAISSGQLSSNNYEAYRMKQQIIELKQKIQRLQNKPQQNQNAVSKTSVSFISCQKLLPNDSTIDSNNRSLKCKNCKTQSQSMQQLTNQIQRIKYQFIQKNNYITTLCQSIQKLQGQLRVLEKPRNFHKKYNIIINQLNNEIVTQKAKDLNYKYMKLIR